MELPVDRGDCVGMVAKGCPLKGFAQAFLIKEKCPYGRKKAWCESMEGLRMGRESRKTRRNADGVISRFGETERRGGAQ